MTYLGCLSEESGSHAFSERFDKTQPPTTTRSMSRSRPCRWPGYLAVLLSLTSISARAQTLERVQYHHPGLAVDLGVGLWAWPMPLDYDGDGDFDLLVGCPDKPYNGVYLFENPTGKGVSMPVFKPGKRLGKAVQGLSLSWDSEGHPHVLSGNREFPNFRSGDWTTTRDVYPQDRVVPIRNLRDNFWKYADYDGDGRDDLVVGHDDWSDFGWFDSNDWWKRYDARGAWTGGPLRGRLFWLRNTGSKSTPNYADASAILAGGRPLEVYGRPGQNLADFDGDGDLDILCGEFLDGFTYFANLGTRSEPRYAEGKRLEYQGRPLVMDLQMIVPAAVDWDSDGDQDLVVGDEDGRVAFVEHTGQVKDGVPVFLPPRYFQQEATDLKCGALATPVGWDWDGDGDEDIVSGNTAGYLLWFENLSGHSVEFPRWAAPRALQADGQTIRIQAGPNGSIQGPAEAKWGYTTLSIADWDLDGLADIVVNSIWGRVHWYRNQGTATVPRLGAAKPIEVEWPGEPPKPAWLWWNPTGKELVTQWRTTPVVADWNGDGLPDLVMLDHEGYLAFFERQRRGEQLVLLPGKRALCDEQGQPLRWNPGQGGRSGRRKLTVIDWDRDGQLDLLVNSRNAELWRQTGKRDGNWLLTKTGDVSDRNIEGHDTSPTTVDWNGDGVRDLLIGAEDGRFYYLRRSP